MVIDCPRVCVKNIMKTALKTSLFKVQASLILAALFYAPVTAPAAQAVWQAIVNTSTDTNWSDPANWQGGTPPAGNNCVFNDATGVGNNTIINNVVDTSENPASLLYTNIGTFQNTLILPGNTLTVGSLTMGNTSAFGANPSAPPTTTISGAGATLVATNGAVTVGFAYASATGGSVAVLNMSDLDNFIATNITALSIGSGATRMAGTLYLATNNVIRFAGASSSASPGMIIGSNSSNNGPGAALYLGQMNIFYVNDIGMGLKKQNSGNGGQILFNPALSNPVAYFYGTNGVNSRVATWAIGDGQTQSGTITCQGTANFTGGSVYANVGNMWLARNSTVDSGGSPATEGTLTLSAGLFSVNNLTNGWIVSPSNGPSVTGTINVNGTAVLSINNTLTLAATNVMTNYAAALFECQGFLYINGGTVMASNIVDGGGGDNGGGYNAYIQMTGGTLAVSNAIGSAFHPVDYFVLQSSPTLQFPIINGVTNVQVQSLYSDGSAATINITSVPLVASYPTQFPILTYANGTGSGAPFSLGTLPGTFMGYVSNDNTSTVWLVITNGPATVKLDQWGGGVNNNWDTTTLNWTNNGTAVNYNEQDQVLFDDSAQTGAVNLTAPHTPQSWTVTNNLLNYTFTGSGVQGNVGLVKSGSASVTLSENGDAFSQGISVLGGKLILDQPGATNSGGLSIAAGATVQVGNADANGVLPSGPIADNGTLVFDQTVNSSLSPAMTGTGGLTQEGAGILTLSAVNTYSGNTVVTSGTLALTNAGSISDSAAVTINNATLDVSAESATTLNSLALANASLNVSVAYLSTPVNVSSLSLGGSANTINIASLPSIASYPTTLTLIQSASAVSGSDISLGAVPSASPSYAGSVSVSGSQVLLTLTSGPVGVRPYVTWTGADVPNLNTNWSDNLNWQSPNAPHAGEAVIFNSTAAQPASALSTPGGGSAALDVTKVDNIVNTGFTIASLSYTNIGGTFHNTYIVNGATLTLTNGNTNSSANIFADGSSSVDLGETAMNNVTISGPEAVLTVDNTNNNFFVGMESATGAGALSSTLDMSALGTLNATVNSFEIGALPEDTDYLSGSAYLAQNNVITAVGGTNNEAGQNEPMSFMVGENGKTGSTECFLYLGQQNTINANYIGVGLAKQSAEMLFNPIWANPSVTIRGNNGVGPVVVWDIGDGLDQSGASASPRGTNDFTGGTVDALVTTMNLGRSPGPSGASNPSEGTLTFGAGTISVATLNAGYQFYANNDFGVGLINVNGTGLLQVGSLNLGLTAGASTNVTSGTLNINGATAEIGTITAGLGSRTNTASTVNLTGGTLVISNAAGVASAPLTALNLAGGTLQLNVNGASTATNVVATTITTSGTTILKVGALTGVTTGVTYPLIAYTGADPYSSLSLSLPSGYQGALVDNPGVVGLQLTVTPPSAPPRFTSISVNGTTLSIAGTNGTANGSFILLETTNIAPPVQWTPALTNAYNSNGAFNLSTNILSPATHPMFFTLTNVP
jgi:fibronectin-binding autotransporter adhesin